MEKVKYKLVGLNAGTGEIEFHNIDEQSSGECKECGKMIDNEKFSHVLMVEDTGDLAHIIVCECGNTTYELFKDAFMPPSFGDFSE